MKELEALEAWLTDRINEYEAWIERYRQDGLQHMLLICSAKRNEALTIRSQVREMCWGAK